MPPDRSIVVGVAGLVVRDGRIILIRRGAPAADLLAPGQPSYAVDGVGEYGLPGGWLDADDLSIGHAAVREIVEETGVIAEPVRAVGHSFTWRENGHERIVTIHVLCRHVAGEPSVMEPDKCPWVGWVPIPEVELLPLFAPLRVWWPERESLDLSAKGQTAKSG
jgi:ADP-ribose pyrophosphatase YjhB (NUDIX family)